MHQPGAAPRADPDALLAQALLARGLLDPSALERCRAEQARRARLGASASLADLVVEGGFVDRAALVNLVRTPEGPRLAPSSPPRAAPAGLRSPQGIPGSDGRSSRAPLGLERVPRVGDTLAGCRLEAELGRGGMGVVFRGRDPDGRPVAVKALLGMDATETRRERFRREVALTRSLDHPGVVRVLGADPDGPIPCLILELVEGRDLEAVLAEETLPLERRLDLVEQVCRAVHHAHGRQVIHRDLKPANVLVTAEGQAKVTDFGLARDLGRETRLSKTGASIGTPTYMAPEQVRGDKHAGRAVDVYALGTLLYECLAGEPPFTGFSALDLYDQIVEGRATPPSRVDGVDPGVGPEHDAVCATAMAVDPALRYPSALALALDVAALRQGRRVSVARRRRRGPLLALAGAGALALAITLASALGLAADETADTGANAPADTTGVGGPGTLADADLEPAPDRDPPPALEPGRDLADRPEEAGDRVGSVNGATDAPPGLADVLHVARDLLERGRLEAAQRVIATAPDLAVGAAPADQRAFAQLRAHLEEALPLLETAELALEQPPKDAAGRRNPEEWLNIAKTALDRLDALSPRSARNQLLRARLHDLSLEFEAAHAATARALMLADPDDRALTYEAYQLLAAIAHARTDRAATLRALEAAIVTAPERVEGYVRRGLVLLLFGGPEDPRARADLARALALAPRDPAALRAMASLHWNAALKTSGQPQREALSEVERICSDLIERDPSDAAAYGLRASGRARAGFDHASIEADYRAALTHYGAAPGLASFFLQRGQAARLRLENQGRQEDGPRARAALLRAIFEAPLHPVVTSELAIVMFLQTWRMKPPPERALNQASRGFEFALEYNSLQWETHFYRGHLRRLPWSGQDVEAAVGDFTRALELKPAHAWSHLGRGSCHLALGRLTEAEADARAAVAEVPSLSGAWDLLEQALRAQGREPEAERVARERPGS